MRIALTTLGCKINQYESELIRRDLLSKGNTIVPFDADADVYIINTCSVTAKSDYQCRQAIRSAARRTPEARIVVTGCYASTRPEELKEIPGVSLVIGNSDKTSLPFRIMNELSGSGVSDPEKNIGQTTSRDRTRGFLKIQDGCNNRCSYCIVPLARGASRSLDRSIVAEEFERLVEEGCPEIVLTGIHIGTYGVDLPSHTDLTGLTKHLITRRKASRIRLSSIEPQEVTRGLIQLLGNGLCRHLHIPLQSGDNDILNVMNRKYTAEFYLDLLNDISEQVPGIALGADIMVGFPGEGEREFENTCKLVQQSPLTHLHVFSYSRRPGTPAAEMKAQVPEPSKKERSEILRRLGQEKNLEFRKKQTGARLKAVVENKKDVRTGLLTGLTDNYIRVLLEKTEKSHIGQEIDIMINRVEEANNYGFIL
jgi:threonylcarbamoyladenosine tRNA methylthiotransferase MtaB